MKQLLLLFSMCLSSAIFAQNSKLANKLSIGYSFSPDYNFRSLQYGGDDKFDLIIKKSRNEMEKAKFGYTTGLNVTFNFSDLLSFETGVCYTNKGYRIMERYINTFPADPNFPDRAAISYCYQYIGIPIKARFSFGKGKIRIISSAGVMTGFLVNVKTTMNYKYGDGKTEKKNRSSTSGFNKVDLSPMVGIGVDYKLTDKIHLSAEPTFRFGLIKTVDAPIKENLWNAGVVFSVSYHLKK